MAYGLILFAGRGIPSQPLPIAQEQKMPSKAERKAAEKAAREAAQNVANESAIQPTDADQGDSSVNENEPNEQPDTDQPDNSVEMEGVLPKGFDLTERPFVDILDKKTCPEKLADLYSDEERATIAQLYADGLLTREPRAVKVSAKTAGSDKDEYWPFWAYIPKGVDECVTMSNSVIRPRPDHSAQELKAMNAHEREVAKTWGLVDYWAYGYYLQFTTPIRGWIMDKSGGEEKVITKQAEKYMKSGLFDSLEEAREAVLEQRAKKAAKAAAELAASEVPA
jgi:hypothetical protein